MSPRSRKLRLHVLGSRLHKWLALFIGVQALLWMATGTIMSFLKIEQVRSEHVISREAQVLGPGAELPQWIGARKGLVAVTTRSVAGEPMVELQRQDGSSSLHHPVTGRQISPLPEAAARRIALSAWTGPPVTIARTQMVRAPIGTEFGGPLPAWQVRYADADGTRLYIDASNGALLGARSDTWRLFDFVWGLHIMDWTQRDRINSWWLLVFGIGGTLIALSGFVLLANRFPRRRKRAGPRS